MSSESPLFPLLLYLCQQLKSWQWFRSLTLKYTWSSIFSHVLFSLLFPIPIIHSMSYLLLFPNILFYFLEIGLNFSLYVPQRWHVKWLYGRSRPRQTQGLAKLVLLPPLPTPRDLANVSHSRHPWWTPATVSISIKLLTDQMIYKSFQRRMYFQQGFFKAR